jgi:hypothetical protein
MDFASTIHPDPYGLVPAAVAARRDSGWQTRQPTGGRNVPVQALSAACHVLTVARAWARRAMAVSMAAGVMLP